MAVEHRGELEGFRAAVRAWLQANVPTERLPPAATEQGLEAHREWERKLHAAGYSVLEWPREFGGGGAGLAKQAAFQEEYVRSGAPERLNRLALGLAGPTLIAFGTTEQQARWLPGMASCSELWCQGFSEPEAGSDLANLRSLAELDGDDLVVTGHKTWTSLAAHADWMFALVRTDTSGPKQHGITYVMIPMCGPGVTVQPLRQLHGEPGFAEVFLDEVRVPIANVIGELHDGWRIASASLAFERGHGLGDHVRFSRDVVTLVELVERMGLAQDGWVRDQVAQRFVETEVFRHHMQRVVGSASDGVPGLEASLTKLFWSEMEVRLFETMMAVAGPMAELTEEASGSVQPHRFHRRYWHARAACIFAGTNEIQRNIVAQRLLGLPRGE